MAPALASSTSRRGALRVFNLSERLSAPVVAQPSGQKIDIPMGHVAAISIDGHVYIKAATDE